MKKTYKVTHFDGGEMTVEIDHSIMTEEALHEINNFWSNAALRLSAANGNVLHAVLKQLLQLVLSLDVGYGYNVQGIISCFDWDAPNGGEEGWPKMDGSEGIRIVDFEGYEFDTACMDVEEAA